MSALTLNRDDRNLLCKALDLWIQDNQQKRDAVVDQFGPEYVGRQSTRRKRAEELYSHFAPPVLEV